MPFGANNNPEMGGGRSNDRGGRANSRNSQSRDYSSGGDNGRDQHYRQAEAAGWDNASVVGALTMGSPQHAAAAASFMDANNRSIDTARPDSRRSGGRSGLGADEFGAGNFGNTIGGLFGIHERPTTIAQQGQTPNYRAEWGFDPMRAPVLGAALGGLNPMLGAAYGIGSNLYQGRPLQAALSPVPFVGPLAGAMGMTGNGVDDMAGTRRPMNYGTHIGFGQDPGGRMTGSRGMAFGGR